MANDWNHVSAQRLTAAAIAFAAGFGLHGIDHLRRGMAASPTAVMIGGSVQGCWSRLQSCSCWHHRRPPEAAIVVGLGSAALFVYAHLLPPFLPAYQDSFVSGPRINVTW